MWVGPDFKPPVFPQIHGAVDHLLSLGEHNLGSIKSHGASSGADANANTVLIKWFKEVGTEDVPRESLERPPQIVTTGSEGDHFWEMFSEGF